MQSLYYLLLLYVTTGSNYCIVVYYVIILVTSLQCYECQNGYCSSDTDLGSVRQCVVSGVCYKIVTDTTGEEDQMLWCYNTVL